MKRSVGFHPAAVDEATAAVLWYRERSEAAAGAFTGELDAAVNAIVDAPERCPQYVADTRRFVFRRFPFFVVYRLGDEQIDSGTALASNQRYNGLASRSF